MTESPTVTLLTTSRAVVHPRACFPVPSRRQPSPGGHPIATLWLRNHRGHMPGYVSSMQLTFHRVMSPSSHDQERTGPAGQRNLARYSCSSPTRPGNSSGRLAEELSRLRCCRVIWCSTSLKNASVRVHLTRARILSRRQPQATCGAHRAQASRFSFLNDRERHPDQLGRCLSSALLGESSMRRRRRLVSPPGWGSRMLDNIFDWPASRMRSGYLLIFSDVEVAVSRFDFPYAAFA